MQKGSKNIEQFHNQERVTMMITYKIKLHIESGFITPFQADMIFGHMCWAVAHRNGDSALKEFLEPFKKKQPPFILSDGFPEDLLPKPLTADFNASESDLKKIKKLNMVSFEDFERIRRGEKFNPTEQKDISKTVTTPHNTISRITNTTPPEGGVYSLEEIFVSSVTVYLKTNSVEWKNRVLELLEDVSQAGYGRKKSIGKGQFSIKDVEEFEFPSINNPDGFVTLSNFCPTEDDPKEGFYKTFVKYGKLGEEFTFTGNPFKKPIIMIKAGSVFKTDGSPNYFYGHMVRDISPAKPEVVHYAYAFAAPIYYKNAIFSLQ